MSEIIGSAFVRIRPDTTMFASETKSQLNSAIKRAAVLGGVSLGLAEVIRQVKEANRVERERELITNQADTALKAAGKSWRDYGSEIDRVIQKQSQMSAFDDEDLLRSFTLLFRSTKDVNKALDLNALAANVARGRNLDLVRTAQLLVRVQAGQVGSLRRLGIQIDKNATGQQALAAVQRQYAGSAVTFARSQEGAQARLNKVWNDTQEIIGQQLSPTIANYQRKLAEWLNTANENGDTQRILNETLGRGKEVVEGIAGAFRILHEATAPVVDALGGVKNAVQLLVLAMAARRIVTFGRTLRDTASAFGFISSASRATTEKVVADARIAEAALDTAYRNRVMTVSVVERVAPFGGGNIPPRTPTPNPESTAGRLATDAAAGAGGALSAKAAQSIITRTIGRVSVSAANAAAEAGFKVGFNPFTLVTAAVLLSGGANRQERFARRQYPEITQLLVNAQKGRITPQQQAALAAMNTNKSVAEMTPAELARLETLLRAAKIPNQFQFGLQGFINRAGTLAPAQPFTPAKPKLTAAQVQARIGAFEETQTNATLADDRARRLRSLTAERAFITDAIKTARLNVAQRRDLKNQLVSVNASIDSINQEIAQEQKTAAEKAADTRRRAAATEDKAFNTRVTSRVNAFERQRRQAANRDDLAAQRKAIDSEIDYLQHVLTQTKAGSDRRERIRQLIQTARDRLAVLAKKAKTAAVTASGSGIDTVFAALERQRREAAARKDIDAQNRILNQEEAHLKLLLENAKKGSARQQTLLNQLSAVRVNRTRLNQGKTSTASTGGGTDFFTEAVQNWLAFGSTISSSPQGILSGQQARAFLAAQFLGKRGTAPATPDEALIGIGSAQLGELKAINQKLGEIGAWATVPVPGGNKTPARWGWPDGRNGLYANVASADKARFAAVWGYWATGE